MFIPNCLQFAKFFAPTRLLGKPQLRGGLHDDLLHLVGRLGDEAARVVLGPDSIGKCFAKYLARHDNNSGLSSHYLH